MVWREYLLTAAVMALTNFEMLSAEDTKVEKAFEPVQPPMETPAFTFCIYNSCKWIVPLHVEKRAYSIMGCGNELRDQRVISGRDVEDRGIISADQPIHIR